MSSDADYRPGDRVIFEDYSGKYPGEVVRTKPKAAVVKFDDDGREYLVRSDWLYLEEE